jgi:hypothetical protein
MMARLGTYKERGGRDAETDHHSGCHGCDAALGEAWIGVGGNVCLRVKSDAVDVVFFHLFPCDGRFLAGVRMYNYPARPPQRH